MSASGPDKQIMEALKILKKLNNAVRSGNIEEVSERAHFDHLACECNQDSTTGLAQTTHMIGTRNGHLCGHLSHQGNENLNSARPPSFIMWLLC